MFQISAGIWEETESGTSFSHLVQDHLSVLSKEFERYFPMTTDPRNAKEWICDPFVNMPGASSMYIFSNQIGVPGLLEPLIISDEYYGTILPTLLKSTSTSVVFRQFGNIDMRVRR